jgi:hypothetical protein
MDRFELEISLNPDRFGMDGDTAHLLCHLTNYRGPDPFI